MYFIFMISFALVVLEDLFGSRKELIDLEKIGKLLQISINANSKKLITTSRSVTKLTYNSGRCFTVVLFWQVNILFNGESLQLCIFLISTFLCFFFLAVNMRKLMSILDQQQLANLCRVLSFSLSDLESVEERSTCEFDYCTKKF